MQALVARRVVAGHIAVQDAHAVEDVVGQEGRLGAVEGVLLVAQVAHLQRQVLVLLPEPAQM